MSAIRAKDAPFLATNVDDEGVFLGVDSNRITAAKFRKELASKKGAYCVLFDLTCLHLPKGVRQTQHSLRELLKDEHVSLEAHDVDGFPQTREVTVKKDSGSPEILFTLVFRHTGKTWKLQQIEYD